MALGDRRDAGGPFSRAFLAALMTAQPSPTSYPTRPDQAASLVVLSSIARFIDIFGDPWSVLLLRDVYLGVTRFEEFQKHLGITRQTLSNRLQTFQDNGILVRVPYQDRPARYEYRLTEKGRELGDFALMIWVWQNRWAGPHSLLPRILRHRTCGYFLVPQMVCAACRSPLELADISVEAGPGRIEAPRLRGRGRRWAALEARRDGTPGQNLLKGTYVIGDRWSNLILASVLLGIRSFDAMVSVLGISTNILSHRLKICVEVGLLAEPTYNADARAYDYGLTGMSRELLPLFLSISEWSDRWLRPEGAALPVWRHDLCGNRLEPLVTGRCCGQPVHLADVRFQPPGPPVAISSGPASSAATE